MTRKCLRMISALLVLNAAAGCTEPDNSVKEILPGTSGTPAQPSVLPAVQPSATSPIAARPIAQGATQVRGSWTVTEKSVESPDEPVALLQFVDRPPADYAISLTLQRLSGDNTFAIGLPIGGQQVLMALDAHAGKFSGLEFLDGKTVNDNEATYRGQVLPLNRAVKVVCTVRTGAIACTVDDAKVIDWKGDTGRLSLPSGFEVPDRQALFFTTLGSRFAIRDIHLTSADGPVPSVAAADVKGSENGAAKLLDGNPTVPAAGIDDLLPGDLRINATITDGDELKIFRDRAEWNHITGGEPAAVRLNGVEWNAAAERTLSNTGSTKFLPDTAKFAGCTFVVVEGRGRMGFAILPDHVKIQINDPDPGSGEYEIIVRQGLTLPRVDPAPATIENVAVAFRRSPQRPLPRGDSVRTHADFEKHQVEFRRTRLVQAYDKSGKHDARWDEAARALLERATKMKPDPAMDLVAAGDDLIAKGCDDPLVCFIYAYNLWQQNNAARAERFALHAVLAFEKSNYPKRTTRLAPLLLAQICRKQAPEKKRLGYGLLARGIEETVAAASGPFAPGEQRAFFTELEDDLIRDARALLVGNRHSLARSVSASKDVDPWLAHMILAQYHIDQAWQGRGTGYANTVSEEGWETFGEGIEQARAHLVEAWQLHTEFPEAAVGLIQTTMAIGGVARETTRFWFDEAVAAEFNAPRAHAQLVLDLLPRWHGSHQALLKFGLECLETNRFDTEVPWTLQKTAVHVEAEEGDLRKLLADLKATDALEKLYSGYEQQVASDPQALKRLKTENLVFCWRRGWRAEAQSRLAKLGDQLDEDVLKQRHVTAEQLRDDLASAPVSFAKLPELRVIGKDVRIAKGAIMQACLSPDGKLLAVSSAVRGGALQVVTLTGEVVNTFPIDPACHVPRLQFSPDGKFLAGALSGVIKRPSNQTLRWGTASVWTLGEPKGRDLLPRERGVIDAVAWLPNQRFIAVAANHSAVILDVASAGPIVDIAEKSSHCTAIAVSPDSKFLATGHMDGEVGLWEIPPAENLISIGVLNIMKKALLEKRHGSAVIDLEFSPDGMRLASSSDKDRTVWLWSTETRNAIKRVDGRRVAISPDSQLLVTCDGPTDDRKMIVWSAISGEPVARIPGRDGAMFFDAIFTPDGNKLVGVNQNGFIRTWNAPKPNAP